MELPHMQKQDRMYVVPHMYRNRVVQHTELVLRGLGLRTFPMTYSLTSWNLSFPSTKSRGRPSATCASMAATASHSSYIPRRIPPPWFKCDRGGWSRAAS